MVNTYPQMLNEHLWCWPTSIWQPCLMVCHLATLPSLAKAGSFIYLWKTLHQLYYTMGVTHNTSSRISSFILSFICPVSLNYSCFKNTQILIYLLILSCLLFSLQAYLSLFLCLSSNISRHLKKDQDGFRRLSKVNF